MCSLEIPNYKEDRELDGEQRHHAPYKYQIRSNTFMQQAQAENIVKSMTREDSNINPKIV